jgi:guanylate kinase
MKTTPKKSIKKKTKMEIIPMIKLFAMGVSLEEIKSRFPTMKEEQMKEVLGRILQKISFKS